MSAKIIILSIIGFFVVIFTLAFLLVPEQKPGPATLVFSAQDVDRPKAETSQVFSDLGEIKVSDVKQEDFILKNVGTKPLQILSLSSNCGCTTGQIVYQGQASKEYSMRSKSGFVTEIAPGDRATVRLTYRPATMPVYGLVEREVYVLTNDPVKQKLIFSIRAIVK